MQKPERKRLKQQRIRASLKEASSAAADSAIAKFFYGNALPFAAAGARLALQKHGQGNSRSPCRIRAYVPPNLDKLGSKLLDECYSYVARHRRT